MAAQQGTGRRVVVVGVDGSGTDRSALEWAARAAVRYGTGLRVVHASEVLAAGAIEDDPVMASPAVLEALYAHDEERVAPRLAEEVRRDYPGLEVTVTEASGAASATLLDQQDDALLLVVGSGRRGRPGEQVLGTSALSTSMHAHRPVVVVPQGVETDREAPAKVVVAVDGSRDSRAAAQVAMVEAELTGAAVVAVSAWYLEVVNGYVVTEPDSEEWRAIEARQTERVEAAMQASRDRHPGVPVTVAVVHAPSSRAILERADGAALLVVGSRGRGGFTGKLLGSVSQKVLRGATCPVAVVKAPPGH
ncbi:universal stress protein [Ornithinicoccus halotolerans]|uniref:universal stress protein n=1 Tax=Ornithinicoccus halotolerans TaxID=1748220 RepID=UPI001885CA8A|nr:universal stress protein [Ornithinicoccus halotolerans]